MRKRVSRYPLWLVFSVVLIWLLGMSAQAGVDYSGALTSFSSLPGLQPVGLWQSLGFDTIGWDVSQNPNGTWHYVYALSVPQLDVHHFIIELPVTATAADILNPAGNFTSFSVGNFAPGATFPFLPGPIFGVDFLTTAGTATQIAFDTTLAPAWGNFYAQDGESAVSNTGFLLPNPPNGPTCGSVNNKLLVPTTGTSPIPDGSTIVLACFGTLQLLAVRKKIFR